MIEQPCVTPDPPAPAPVPAPLLLSDRQAAALCGVSRVHWHRLRAAGKLPSPVKLGRKVLWRGEELRAWIQAGCPDARTWEAMQAVSNANRRANRAPGR